MPIDASIYAQIQPPPLANPFALANQMQQLQVGREQAAALEADRLASAEATREKAEAAARDNADEQNVRAWFAKRQPGQPVSDADVTDLASQVGFTRAKTIADGWNAMQQNALKTEGDVRAHLGAVVGGIKALPTNMQEPAYNAVVQEYGARGWIDPKQAFTYSPAVLDYYQREAMSPTEQQAESRTAQDQTIKLRNDAAGILGSAVNAQDYADKYSKLDPTVQRTFPPPQAWSPQLQANIRQTGMSAEQQTQAAQQAVTAAEQHRHDIATEGQAAATLKETTRHNQVEESFQDPTSAKNQNMLEQQYRGVLQRELSSRSGGLGLEDRKVNQALHLLQLFDQNKDKNGQYNIPPQLVSEAALGLARLTSPNGNVGLELENKLEPGSLKGDVGKALQYLTGAPQSGSTQQLLQMLRDSIVRQGNQAQTNREGYFNAIRAMAPTALDPGRRQQLEQALKLNQMPAEGSSAGTVLMRSPDGESTKPVPADQVEHFKALGATVVSGG